MQRLPAGRSRSATDATIRAGAAGALEARADAAVDERSLQRQAAGSVIDEFEVRTHELSTVFQEITRARAAEAINRRAITEQTQAILAALSDASVGPLAAEIARARRVVFTATGLAWLQAFRDAVLQAEREFREAVGDEVATVVALGLEAYAH